MAPLLPQREYKFFVLYLWLNISQLHIGKYQRLDTRRH